MSKSKDMSGAIFRNKRKEKDTHPDRTGQCTIAGVEYWISGWVEETSGEQYLSVKFKVKEAAEPKRGAHGIDSDIPF